jgi:hypothetical protein
VGRALEVLNVSFVFFGRFAGRKGAKILALARFRVGLSGIQAELSGLEFSNHAGTISRLDSKIRNFTIDTLNS